MFEAFLHSGETFSREHSVVSHGDTANSLSGSPLGTPLLTEAIQLPVVGQWASQFGQGRHWRSTRSLRSRLLIRSNSCGLRTFYTYSFYDEFMLGRVELALPVRIVA